MSLSPGSPQPLPPAPLRARSGLWAAHRKTVTSAQYTKNRTFQTYGNGFIYIPHNKSLSARLVYVRTCYSYHEQLSQTIMLFYTHTIVHILLYYYYHKLSLLLQHPSFACFILKKIHLDQT